MLKIYRTQGVGRQHSMLYDTIVREERALTLGWIIGYLRPLQRCVLQHLWRPNGPMHARLYDAIRAM